MTIDNADLLKEAKERFKLVLEKDKENRDTQRIDTLFVYSPGEQWPQDVKRQRKEWKELCLEFNQLKQFVAQVVNDQRQNRPGIRIHPADGEATKEVAEVIQGLIRSIEYESKAEAAYDNAFAQAVVGGRGWWRVRSEYCSEDGFDQKLVIDPIIDSLSVYADIDYQQPDGSDRRFAFVTERISKEEFKRQWPDKQENGWDDVDSIWITEDDVLVCDYYRRVCTTRTRVRMSDGAEGWLDEMPTPPEGVTIAQRRECDTYSVEWYKLGGNQVLEKYDWPGTMIPVICTTGDDMMLDGKRVYQGLTRHARDAQSMLNFGMTQQAIHLSLTPRAPWVAAEGQIEGYENIWKDANVKNFSVLPYKPTSVDGHVVPPPQRTAPSLPDTGWINWCGSMISMIRSTIGMYENSLGIHGAETSGKAIIAREKQGDNATFNYVDNLSRAIALTGRIIVEVLPKYYDTQRKVHTIGLDESRNEVVVNQATVNPDDPTQSAIENDLSRGKYSVVVEAGPSYATKRQESAETLTQIVQAYPPLMQIAGDIVLRAQDIPDADALADRIKLTLPPNIQQAEQAKQQGGRKIDPQAMAMLAQKDQQLQQAAQMAQELGNRVQELESVAAEKLQAMQVEVQQKERQAQLDAQIEIEKARATAAATLEKARIDKETRIEVAMIQRQTDLEVAEINAGLKMATEIHKTETQIEQQSPPSEGLNFDEGNENA